MVNLELEKYITEARTKGMSDDVIRQELLKVGWNLMDIDNSLINRSNPISNNPMDTGSLPKAETYKLEFKNIQWLIPLFVILQEFWLSLLFSVLGACTAFFLFWKNKSFNKLLSIAVIESVHTLLIIFATFVPVNIYLFLAITISLTLAVLVTFIRLIKEERDTTDSTNDQKSLSGSNPPFYSILSISFLVALISYSILGGGWEVLIYGPFFLILLLVSVRMVGSMLKKYNGGWFATFLSLFVISTTIILMRLAIPGVSDSPEPFYIISFLSQNLLKETPDLSANYGQTISFLLLATVIYFFGSLILIKYSIKKTGGKVNRISLVIIIFSMIAISVYALLPLGSAWTKFRSPEHSDRVAKMDMQNAVYDDMTNVSSARSAAFRVYNYNNDSTRKTTPSYIGTCEDAAFKSTSPYMTCRESNDAFIMYFKINDEFGYACGDAISYGIVDVEPTGLYCGGNVSVPPAPIIRKGTPVNEAFSHIGVSKTATVSDCGILKYKDNAEQSGDIGASDCFNQAISSCRPAVISGVTDGFITTYQVIGEEGGKCILTQSFFKQVSNMETQSAFQKCVIDSAVGWSSLSDCADAQ